MKRRHRSGRARTRLTLSAALLALLGLAVPLRAEPPDVLVLGDSQLTFGAGVAFADLLAGMAGTCGLAPKASVGVIGVRSSALRSWTGRSRASKAAICDVDPKWRVNAAAYGTLSQGESPFVQIGRGAAFQFCTPERSPLRAVFHDGYYRPRLVIMFLMGNAAERWAASPEAAMEDARAFAADLPAGQACIFMTSAPPYREKDVQLRLKAQDNIGAAFEQIGQCSFVPGLTEETIALNQGQAAHFRRKPSGAVKDPLHPTEAAARAFLDLRQAALCAAISTQLAPSPFTEARSR